MKNLLSLALVALFTITASNLLACKGAGCGFNKNTSASIEKVYKSQCGFGARSAKSSASVKALPSDYVEANVISVSDNGVKQYRCPVSGFENTVSADTRFIDYESKRYYVDCPGSEAKFTANPAKYVLAMQSNIKSGSGYGSNVSKSCCPSGVKNTGSKSVGKSS